MDMRTILFVDGENLVFRYQDELKAGKKPADGVVHEPDVFVWHPGVATISHFHLFRVCYYTTVVGDDAKVVDAKEKLARVVFRAQSGPQAQISGQIVPVVFKKPERSRKTRVVDIHLVIEVMKYAFSNTVDLVYLISGDQDYLPLITEVMHQGKQVYVGALSSGLGQPLTYSCDEFFNLDRFFFKTEAPSAT